MIQTQNQHIMKRLFLTLAIAAFAYTSNYAQTGNDKDKLSPAQKAEKSTAKLQKELILTADQKQKIYAIELDKFNKSEALHKSGHDAKKAQKDQHDAIKKETDAKLDRILTADQKKKLAAIKTEKKAKKKEKKEKK